MNREIQDMIVGLIILSTTTLALWGLKSHVEHLSTLALHTQPVVKPESTIDTLMKNGEESTRQWIIDCRDLLDLRPSDFNTQVDSLFMDKFPNQAVPLDRSSKTDEAMRKAWFKIAEEVLSRQSQFKQLCSST